MKSNIQREMSYFHLERKRPRDFSKSSRRKESNSENKSVDKLSEINLDIEKLYKKYAEVKKERLLKEKSQQILVNRLKVLRSQQSKSKNKEKLRKAENFKKIHVKINSKYKYNNKTLKRHRLSFKSDKNEKEYKYNNYKTINDNDNRKENIITTSNVTNSNNNEKSNSEKEKINRGNYNGNININNIDDFLQKYKYNIGNKNSNNNIYIIINNPNNFSEKQAVTSERDYNNYTQNSNNNNIQFNKIDKVKKHINSDHNINFGSKGENIILMNAQGRKIEDIINSINYIINKDKSESDYNFDFGKKKKILF